MRLHDLSLATRVTIGVLVMVAAGTATLMFVESARLRDAYLSERRVHLEGDLAAEEFRLKQSINALRQDVLFLSNIPPVSGIVRAALNHGYDARDGDAREKWEKRLFGIFSAFSTASPKYYRIGYIAVDDVWKELGRVDNRHGLIDITPPGQLLTVGEMAYFKAALKLKQGQVWLSEIDLNPDAGNPPVRTLRAVTPVFAPSGKMFGMVVINLDVGSLLKPAVSDLPGVQSYIANNAGQYLVHPDSKQAFKFEPGAASGSTNKITTDFPFIASMFEQHAADTLSSQAIATSTGSPLFAARRVYFDPNDPSRFLLLMHYLPDAVMAQQIATIPVNAFVYEFMVMLLVGGMATLVLRRTFSPLRQITLAADKISAGDNDILLPRLDGGEIGSLTSALNAMLSKLSLREKALKESEERYHSVVSALSEGIVLLARDGSITMWNHAAERILGLSGEQLLGRTAFDPQWQAVHEDGTPFQGSSHPGSEVLLTGVPQSNVIMGIHQPDGALRWISINAVPILDPGAPLPSAAVVSFTDISGRKESEQKQRQLTEQISHYADEISDLYEHAPCGYHSLDKDGIFRHINETELKWLGYTWSEIVGKLSLADLLVPDSVRIFRQTFPQFKKMGDVRDVELELIRKDGTMLPVLISATALYDMEGNFMMSRSTVYDMTERRKMEQERIDYLKRLEELSHHLVAAQEDARRRLASELHDRTSPNLAAININLNLLATELSQEQSEDLAERLEDTQALIDDTAASIREICADMRPPLLDYAGLAVALDSYAHQFARRTGITVLFDSDNREERYTPELESLLFRITQEALTNCAKHAQPTSVIVTLSNGGYPIALTITDNGVGFDHSMLGKSGPVGMGMLNMREMAEVLGGKFTIESLSGKGTRITVEIPRA